MGVRSERKEETRRRIMETAETLFRRHGIDGVGVDAIMREAGLTHGGFYLHFASKEALAAEVFAQALARSAARWGAIAIEAGAGETGAGDSDGGEPLARIVEAYLSPGRLSPEGSGCIVPVMGAELARRPDSLPALTKAIRAMAGALAECRRSAGDASSGREATAERALSDFACMVGGVVLARLANGDPALSDQILRAARNAVLDGRPREAG